MGQDAQQYVFVLQHRNPRFDLMPFSIARTWVADKGVDVAVYAMYDAGELLRNETVEANPDIKEAVDYLLGQGAQLYVCGFCSRVCEIGAEKVYPGVRIGNRHIFYELMTERHPVYY